MDVTQFQQYTAVGSGSKYAMGALRVLYDQLDDPGDIAGRAVQVGIDFDVFCGGPIDVVEIEAPRAPTPRLTRPHAPDPSGSVQPANSPLQQCSPITDPQNQIRGTMQATPPIKSQRRPDRRVPGKANGLTSSRNKKAPQTQGVSSEADGTRTRNHRIDSSTPDVISVLSSYV
jgi:hypothetical protein